MEKPKERMGAILQVNCSSKWTKFISILGCIPKRVDQLFENFYWYLLNIDAKLDILSVAIDQKWNRSGFSRPDRTSKFQNLHRLTGRSTSRSTGFWPARLTAFFAEAFYSLFSASNEKFSKGVDHGWGVKICDSEWGSQKKTQKFFALFAKVTQF